MLLLVVGRENRNQDFGRVFAYVTFGVWEILFTPTVNKSYKNLLDWLRPPRGPAGFPVGTRTERTRVLHYLCGCVWGCMHSKEVSCLLHFAAKGTKQPRAKAVKRIQTHTARRANHTAYIHKGIHRSQTDAG